MIAACQQHKVKVALAHQTRYSPKLKVVRELIAADKLGRLLEFRARGKEDARGGGEDLWVLGTHVLDMMQSLGGGPQWCLGTVLQQGRPIHKADVRPGSEGIPSLAGDEVHATYRLEGGAMGFFDSIKEAGGGPRYALWIFGSKGVVEIGTNYGPPAFFLPHPSWSSPRYKKAWVEITSAGAGKPETLKDLSAHRGNVEAVLDLIDAIHKDRKPEADITDARTALEMIVSVFESQRLGKPVPFPLANRKDPLAML